MLRAICATGLAIGIALTGNSYAADVKLPSLQAKGVEGRSAGSTPTGKAFPILGDMADADIASLCYIVMMQAAQSTREDLKKIMDEIKRRNANKQTCSRILNCNPNCPAVQKPP